VLKDVQVTLYDIFGYLLPGFVALAALGALFWAVVAPHHPVTVPNWSGEIWLAVIVSAYLAGHLLQAAANVVWQLLRRSETPRICEVLKTLPADLRKALETVCGSSDPDVIYAVSDAAVLQKGNASEREIFTYREGFYRGMVAAFSVAIIAVIVRWARGGAVYVEGGKTHSVPASAFAFLLGLFCLAAVLSFGRNTRFARFRVAAAIWGFVGMLIVANLDSDEDSA
jgi:hypothetical protein